MHCADQLYFPQPHMPRRVDNRYSKILPLRIDDAISGDLATLQVLVDEWLKNANSYTGNLFLGPKSTNGSKGHFLKEAMRHCRQVGVGQKLYGPYNQLRHVLLTDIGAEDSLGTATAPFFSKQ